MSSKKKDVGYYECATCGSRKKPKQTSVVKELEYMYICLDCKHLGPFDEFLPADTMRFLFC
jgi:hypothetical protein